MYSDEEDKIASAPQGGAGAEKGKSDPYTGERLTPDPAKDWKFDPFTGERLIPEPANDWKFDPYTGERIVREPEKPKPKFDPYTGEPIGAVTAEGREATSDGAENAGSETESGQSGAENTASAAKNYQGGDESARQSDNYFDDTVPSEPGDNYFTSGSGAGEGEVFASGSGLPAADGGRKTGVLGVVSMILGILSVVGASCCFGGNILLSIAAIVTASIQIARGRNGFATAGLITGVVGIVFGVMMIIVFAASGVFDALESEYIVRAIGAVKSLIA